MNSSSQIQFEGWVLGYLLEHPLMLIREYPLIQQVVGCSGKTRLSFGSIV